MYAVMIRIGYGCVQKWDMLIMRKTFKMNFDRNICMIIIQFNKNVSLKIDELKFAHIVSMEMNETPIEYYNI